ncbi:MAG TPA: Hsp20/alpha crystallin family protein [Clostridia bacterium]|nr:Hsp20/alpha crystallin family protein [Clostridia bacterium]
MFGLTPYNRKSNEIAGRNNVWDLRNVFEDFFSDPFFPVMSGNPIKADIRENEKEFIVDAEIPGVKKEDIKLDLRDDTLTISVERNEQVSEERENYIRRERRYGSVSRSFYVENVKNDAVTAKYDSGILTIVLPKDDKGGTNRHKIEIQ